MESIFQAQQTARCLLTAAAQQLPTESRSVLPVAKRYSPEKRQATMKDTVTDGKWLMVPHEEPMNKGIGI